MCREGEGASAESTPFAESNSTLTSLWEAFSAQGSGCVVEGGANIPSPSPDLSWEASGKSGCASGFSRNFNSLHLLRLTLDGGTFFFGFSGYFRSGLHGNVPGFPENYSQSSQKIWMWQEFHRGRRQSPHAYAVSRFPSCSKKRQEPPPVFLSVVRLLHVAAVSRPRTRLPVARGAHRLDLSPFLNLISF